MQTIARNETKTKTKKCTSCRRSIDHLSAKCRHCGDAQSLINLGDGKRSPAEVLIVSILGWLFVVMLANYALGLSTFIGLAFFFWSLASSAWAAYRLSKVTAIMRLIHSETAEAALLELREILIEWYKERNSKPEPVKPSVETPRDRIILSYKLETETADMSGMDEKQRMEERRRRRGKERVLYAISARLEDIQSLAVYAKSRQGKTSLIHGLLHSVLGLPSTGKDGANLIILDPKTVDFSLLDNVEHLVYPRAKTSPEFIAALQFANAEMDRRFAAMGEYSRHRLCNNVSTYHKLSEGAGKEEFPSLIVLCDEVQDVLSDNKEAASLLERLAKVGRAAGVYVWLSTQRPDAKSIPPTIQAQIETLYVGFLSEKAAVYKVLGDVGLTDEIIASMINKKGRFALCHASEWSITQSNYLKPEKLEKRVKKVSRNGNSIAVSVARHDKTFTAFPPRSTVEPNGQNSAVTARDGLTVTAEGDSKKTAHTERILAARQTAVVKPSAHEIEVTAKRLINSKTAPNRNGLKEGARLLTVGECLAIIYCDKHGLSLSKTAVIVFGSKSGRRSDAIKGVIKAHKERKQAKPASQPKRRAGAVLVAGD